MEIIKAGIAARPTANASAAMASSMRTSVRNATWVTASGMDNPVGAVSTAPAGALSIAPGIAAFQYVATVSVTVVLRMPPIVRRIASLGILGAPRATRTMSAFGPLSDEEKSWL